MTTSVRKSYFEIAKNLRRGDILFWKKYRFSNGGQRNKYILVLSNCITGKYYIFTLLTSKIGFYKNPYNQVDIVWLEAKKVKQLPFTTIIDLKHYFSVRASNIGEKLYEGDLKKVTELPDDMVRKIENAVKNAKTLSPRIKGLILE